MVEKELIMELEVVEGHRAEDARRQTRRPLPFAMRHPKIIARLASAETHDAQPLPAKAPEASRGADSERGALSSMAVRCGPARPPLPPPLRAALCAAPLPSQFLLIVSRTPLHTPGSWGSCARRGD